MINLLLYIPLALFSYGVFLVVYRIFFHPLKGFPGPKFAAATKWYEFYFDIVKGGGGLFSYEVERMHERYGPIVRINPHEIHVSDPTWLDSLYPGPGPVRDKYAPSAHMSGVPQGTFGTVDHYIHRQRRSAVKTFVSKKTVQTFQPAMCSTVELLCRELSLQAKNNNKNNSEDTFELSIYLLAWATDSVAKYLENSTYGLLDEEGRRQDWYDTIVKVVELTPLVKQFPAFMPFTLKVPGWLMAVVSPRLNLVLRMHKRMRSTARQYLALHTAAFQEKEKQNNDKQEETTSSYTSPTGNTKIDAYRAILDSSLPAIDKEPDRVAQEVLTLLVGGSATTMRVMMRVVYHVVATEGVEERLLEVLGRVMKGKMDWPGLEELEREEFLVAIVKESLRITTALTARLPLVSPEKALLYKDHEGAGREWVIPPGTPTSMSLSNILMDPTIYTDPYIFRPERWIEGTKEQQARLASYWVPFGRGARMCVGMNFAQAEILICTAVLFRRFRFDVSETVRERDLDVRRDCFLGQPGWGSRGLRVRVEERED